MTLLVCLAVLLALGALIVASAVKALADWPEQWTQRTQCKTCRVLAQTARSEESAPRVHKAA
jgi:hypothetical protein